ncbi:hypothetical protein SAMN06272759_101740 [Novosphingobium sp. B1]|nr:hypothetical protein SAMN06272759_101740 [Novosphingobium sp. B1]
MPKGNEACVAPVFARATTGRPREPLTMARCFVGWRIIRFLEGKAFP